jgi:hypothetical protein
MDTNMQAALLLKERRVLAEDRFVDVAIWRLPKSVSGSAHDFKYHLALVVDDVCVLRFDNEAGKGDHKHVGAQQEPDAFTTLTQLLADFWQGVEDWRPT